MIAAFLVFVTAVVLLWSFFKYQQTSNALVDSFPAEFQEETLWRTAFPVFVLIPSTPLRLQFDYLLSLAGICVGTLGISLCCFLFGKVVAGGVILIAFLAATVGMIKPWMAYIANRNRRMSRDQEEEA